MDMEEIEEDMEGVIEEVMVEVTEEGMATNIGEVDTK